LSGNRVQFRPLSGVIDLGAGERVAKNIMIFLEGNATCRLYKRSQKEIINSGWEFKGDSIAYSADSFKYSKNFAKTKKKRKYF
jgi:hypothetical protein